MQGEEPIRVLITGGTIDKEYDPLTGEFRRRDFRESTMAQKGSCA
jgi:hypothetical protein